MSKASKKVFIVKVTTDVGGTWEDTIEFATEDDACRYISYQYAGYLYRTEIVARKPRKVEKATYDVYGDRRTADRRRVAIRAAFGL